MVRMILADDEPIITKGIQKLVDWNGLGIEIVGEYADGKEALDGIITKKPDIALLDIYMPKKTGIDILRELKQLEINTKIIFISGFQDFQYAKDALKYGADDYLLKPVIKDELIKSVEKCIMSLRQEWGLEETIPLKRKDEDAVPYDRLVKIEETTYVPTVIEIIFQGDETSHERKLIRFSIVSFIEHYLEIKDLGIIFIKNHYIVVVLKGRSQSEAAEILYELAQEVNASTKHSIGAIIGEVVSSMGEIPAGYTKCLDLQGYFFFANQIKIPILTVGVPAFQKNVTLEEFADCRSLMLDTIVTQDRDSWEIRFQRFLRLLCIVSEGKREDACFHFCSSIRVAEDRFQAMGLSGLGLDMKELLEIGRNTENYSQMSMVYRGCFESYMGELKESVINNDKRDIIRAKEYIEKHYKETLTLEVLAREIHMNSYYFSNFFKKHSGENFKDYLNKVRMRHAVNLLISTDKKSYEIADEVGFRDARSFSELFQRMFGETPAGYRKRVKSENA